MKIDPFGAEEVFNEEQKGVLAKVLKSKDEYVFSIDNDQVSVRELTPEDVGDEVELTMKEFDAYFMYDFNMLPEEFLEKLLNHLGSHGSRM